MNQQDKPQQNKHKNYDPQVAEEFNKKTNPDFSRKVDEFFKNPVIPIPQNSGNAEENQTMKENKHKNYDPEWTKEFNKGKNPEFLKKVDEFFKNPVIVVPIRPNEQQQSKTDDNTQNPNS